MEMLSKRSLVDIKRAVEHRLDDWPLLNRGALYYHEYKPTFFSIVYQSPPCWQVRSRRVFTANIIQDVFYLLFIEIDKEERGRGLGAQLYRALELAAKDLNCERLEMMASGWTHSGETRSSYLERHGYTVTPVGIATKAHELLGTGWG